MKIYYTMSDNKHSINDSFSSNMAFVWWVLILFLNDGLFTIQVYIWQVRIFIEEDI